MFAGFVTESVGQDTVAEPGDWSSSRCGGKRGGPRGHAVVQGYPGHWLIISDDYDARIAINIRHVTSSAPVKNAYALMV